MQRPPREPQHLRTPQSSHRRRGLAPVEFVFGTLLFCMLAAIMILGGAIGVTAVRGQVNARYGMFRSVGIRDGSGDPNPRAWQSPATITSGGGTFLFSATNLWESRLPSDGDRKIRGGGTFGGQSVVGTLDIGEGIQSGSAAHRRGLPYYDFLKGTRNSVYDVEYGTESLADEWQFRSSTIGIGDNDARRAENWYDLSRDESAVETAKSNLDVGPDIEPLDRDEHLLDQGRYQDFHVFIRELSADSNPTATTEIESAQWFRSALERVAGRKPGPGQRGASGVPERMASAHITEYREQQDDLRAIDPDDPEIDRLQDLIDELQRFRDEYRSLRP